MKAVRVNEFGGARSPFRRRTGSALSLPIMKYWSRSKRPGLNYIDTYQRLGPVPDPPAHDARHGRRRQRRGGRTRRQESEAGDRVAFTNVMGAYADYVKAPEDRLRADSGRGFLRRRRGRHAARLHRALSEPVHLQAGQERPLPDPRRRGRRRPAADPDGQERRRIRHRHLFHRSQGRTRYGRRRRRSCFSIRSRTSRPK